MSKWGNRDPFGLGPDSGTGRPTAGAWIVFAVCLVLAALLGLVALGLPAAKAAPPGPCDAQAALGPPVQRPLAPPVQVPKAPAVAAPQAPPRLAPTPYRQVRERVENGQRLIVMVNPPAVSPTPTRVGWTTLLVENDEIPPGRYEAFKDADGTAKWELKESYLPPPVTAEAWGWRLAPPASQLPPGQFRGVLRGT